MEILYFCDMPKFTSTGDGCITEIEDILKHLYNVTKKQPTHIQIGIGRAQEFSQALLGVHAHTSFVCFVPEQIRGLFITQYRSKYSDELIKIRLSPSYTTTASFIIDSEEIPRVQIIPEVRLQRVVRLED